MPPLPTTSCPKLECVDISKAYGEDGILADVSLKLHKGEVVAILGASGSGKSTLLKIISGLVMPDKGSVYIDGADCTGKTGMTSFMLQDSLLFPWKTVLENIILPLIISGMKRERAEAKAREYLEQFGLSGCEKLYPAQISGGMARRVSLLRAYMFSSGILLLDEPFSSLDSITRIAIYEWFRQIVDELSISTLLITHDVSEAVYLADRVHVIKGRPASLSFTLDIDIEKQSYPQSLTSSSFLHSVSTLQEALTNP